MHWFMRKKTQPKEAEDLEAPRYMLVRREQPLDFPVDVSENGLGFTVRYWCKHCGHHFTGILQVQVVNHKLAFYRDRCSICHSQETSPHVTPGSIDYEEGEPTLQHYTEAIKLALVVQEQEGVKPQ